MRRFVHYIVLLGGFLSNWNSRFDSTEDIDPVDSSKSSLSSNCRRLLHFFTLTFLTVLGSMAGGFYLVLLYYKDTFCMYGDVFFKGLFCHYFMTHNLWQRYQYWQDSVKQLLASWDLLKTCLVQRHPLELCLVRHLILASPTTGAEGRKSKLLETVRSYGNIPV